MWPRLGHLRVGQGHLHSLAPSSTTILTNRKTCLWSLIFLIEFALVFFMAVILVPPTSSWSRARHVEGGQWPLRSRAQPLGLSVLSAVDRQRVLQSNQVLEVTSWVAHHALCCQVSKVYLLLMMPEDFGGHCESGPSSPWDLPEFRGLQGASDAVRGAAFLCRLAQAEQKHPVGILTNFPGLRDELYLGWPVLERVGDVLTYQGPLPRDCPCALPHRPMIGSSGDIFYSSSAFPFTFYFWVRILRAIHLGSGPSSLRVGGCAAASSGPSPSGSSLPVCTSSWSLQEATESVFPLFAAWSSSSLSRNMLRSYADAGWVDRFLSCTPTGPADSSRSALLERCSLWALGPSSASSLQPSVPPCLGSTASSTLTARTRSRSRSRSKRPLASLRQRVDVDDGNVARLLVTRTRESASGAEARRI